MDIKRREASQWREKAYTVIRDTQHMGHRLGWTADQILAAIDANYPFGPRKHHPYKMWLLERKIALETSPLLKDVTRKDGSVVKCGYCHDKGCLMCSGAI